MLRLSEHRLVYGSLAFVFIVMACGGDRSTSPGVKVRALPTDIGLGAEKQPFPGAIAFEPPLEEDFAPEPPLKTFRTVPPAPPAKEPCPEAAIDASSRFVLTPGPVEKDAAGNPLPKNGSYNWKLKIEGREKGKPFFFELDQPIPRGITGRSADPTGPPGSWKYSIILGNPQSAFGSQTLTFRVVPQSAAESTAPTDVGEGIFLTMIVTQRLKDGNFVTDVFIPSPPVQYLPFPADPGTPITGKPPGQGAAGVSRPQTDADKRGTSTGSDGNRTLTNEGAITDKRRFDACGELIDAWYVDAKQTFRFPIAKNEKLHPSCSRTVTPRQQDDDIAECVYDYDYAFATQLGGLIVFERFEQPIRPSPPPSPTPSGLFTPSPRPTPKPGDPPTPKPTPSPTPGPTPSHRPDTDYIVVEQQIGQLEPSV